MLAICTPAANAARSLQTIVQDDAIFLNRSDAQVDASMARLAAMGVDRVRLTANWSAIAPSADLSQRPTFDATDPNAYLPHAWDRVDRAVCDAAAHGLKVDLDIAFWAPLWATTETSPGRARLNIDAGDYGQFAEAVARRYSGSFVPVGESALPPPPPSLDATLLGDIARAVGQQSPQPRQPFSPPQRPLPRVDMYTIWNEPNYGAFLQPQWVQSSGQRQPGSPQLYRQLVHAAYPAIKGADPGATVLIGGTAAGDLPVGNDSISPLRFIRELACVDDRLRPLMTPGCQNFTPIPGDGWAHHPYSLMKSPGQQSHDPDDATISELPRLTGLLDKLVRMGRFSPGLRDVWITEFGYETSPRLSEADQARFLAWSEYLAWSTPDVRSFAQFLLDDLPGSWQSGLYRQDGSAKLSAQTFPATLWAQYPATSHRRARAAHQPPTMTVWAHLRFAHAPTPVEVERLEPGGVWVPVTGTVAFGARPGERTTQPMTDTSGYLLIRTPQWAGSVLRLEWNTPHGWQAGPPLTAEAIASPTSSPAPCTGPRRTCP